MLNCLIVGLLNWGDSLGFRDCLTVESFNCLIV